jgi:general secretion pathway protein G
MKATSSRLVDRATVTLIELLVVMTIMPCCYHSSTALLNSIDHAKEILRGRFECHAMTDKYYGDVGALPETLDDLVAKKYLRAIRRPDDRERRMADRSFTGPEETRCMT